MSICQWPVGGSETTFQLGVSEEGGGFLLGCCEATNYSREIKEQKHTVSQDVDEHEWAESHSRSSDDEL